MSVIEAMARAYLDALAPGGFRDPEEREAAVLQRIKPMRAALAAAEAIGWKLGGSVVRTETYERVRAQLGGRATILASLSADTLRAVMSYTDTETVGSVEHDSGQPTRPAAG